MNKFMTIDIEQDCEWQRIEEPSCPDDIMSGGMGPCVSILIYDVESKVTYGCHYSSPDMHHSNDVEEMIDSALTEFIDSKSIKVFVSGAVLSDKNSPKKRAFVEGLLNNKFGSNTELIFKWPAVGIETVELIFDPSSGILHEPKT